MTRDGWDKTHFPLPLLRYLADNRSITPRKARLFACACCRLKTEVITMDDRHTIAGIAEDFADGRADDMGLKIAHLTARDLCAIEPDNRARRLAFLATEPIVNLVNVGSESVEWFLPVSGERTSLEYAGPNRILADLIREVFPHSVHSFDSAWRTPAVKDLSQGIYDSRDFAALPILADALEEAGCTLDHLLAHCRDPNAKHVRGCWAVDLVLGKI